MIKTGQGAPIDVEIWRLPSEKLADFIQTIPYPLGLGQVALSNGRQCLGFICQQIEQEQATDITEYRSWRSYSQAVTAI